MKEMSIKQLIREKSNKDLLYTVNKIKKEKENPEKYGKDGTSRWVTQSEFWRGHHKDLQEELKRRQQQGQIKKTAGKQSKARRSNDPFALSSFW